MCDCIAWLTTTAMAELENADKAARDKRTKVHEPVLRRRAHALNAAAGELRTRQRNQEHDVSDTLLGPADADHYRVKVGRYYDRWYVDPLPGDDIAPATDEQWPSVSSVKKASTTDWTFVGLKRVAKHLDDKPDALAGLAYDERYERLKMMNKIGLRRAGDRGTMVHTYLERALRGQPVEQPFDPPDALEYLPAVHAFLNTYQPELIAAELVCINRSLNGVGYGGTADALISIGGKVYLPDWKSRGDDSDHGAYPEEAAQLGGYALADYVIVDGPNGPWRMRLPALDGGLIVSIKPDGHRIYPIDLDKAKTHWTALHAWWVARLDERLAVGKPWAPRAGVEAPDLAARIATAPTVAALTLLWSQNTEVWTQAHTEAAAARKATLTADAA